MKGGICILYGLRLELNQSGAELNLNVKQNKIQNNQFKGVHGYCMVNLLAAVLLLIQINLGGLCIFSEYNSSTIVLRIIG